MANKEGFTAVYSKLADTVRRGLLTYSTETETQSTGVGLTNPVWG